MNARQGILEGTKEAVTSLREKLTLIEEDLKKNK